MGFILEWRLSNIYKKSSIRSVIILFTHVCIMQRFRLCSLAGCVEGFGPRLPKKKHHSRPATLAPSPALSITGIGRGIQHVGRSPKKQDNIVSQTKKNCCCCTVGVKYFGMVSLGRPETLGRATTHSLTLLELHCLELHFSL